MALVVPPYHIRNTRCFDPFDCGRMTPRTGGLDLPEAPGCGSWTPSS